MREGRNVRFSVVSMLFQIFQITASHRVRQHQIFSSLLFQIFRIAECRRVVLLVWQQSTAANLLDSLMLEYGNNNLTTVLLRSPVTQMIFFNHGMLLLGSNHFLINLTVVFCSKFIKLMITGVLQHLFWGQFNILNLLD